MAATTSTDTQHTLPIYWYLFLVLAIGALLFGLYQAYTLRWLSDDIFVTFRYVDQFLSGNGPIYNVGEKVEGYTHFLWFLLLSLFGLFGAELTDISIVMGIVSFVGILCIAIAISYKLSRPSFRILIPFTAVALALNYDFAIWGTSGLETAFYTLLLFASFYAYFFSALSDTRRTLFAGLLLILSVMVRPDGALLYALANALLVARALLYKQSIGNAARQLLLFNVGFVVLYLPYLLWKYNYYGHLFPNTYYAKSGGGSFYEQGFTYLWAYFGEYLTSFLCLLAIPALLVAWKTSSAAMHGIQRVQEFFSNRHIAALLVAMVSIVSYLLLFVARVGGDFMYARFIIPMLPFIYYATEHSLRITFRKLPVLIVALFIALPILIFTLERSNRDALILAEKEAALSSIEGIVDERSYYTTPNGIAGKELSVVEYSRELGNEMRSTFAGLDMTVLIQGSQNILAYYARFPECIIDHGLTDEYIAHLPIENRGRIGHEKHAPLPYLMQRGADFIFGIAKPRSGANYRMVKLRFPETGFEIQGELITYDGTLLRELRKRMGANFEAIDFEAALDEFISKTMAGRTPEEVKSLYGGWKPFYFDHNNDPRREKILLEYIQTGTLPG